uniref:Sushi domain-containing protein n=1 Tax=Leptobrachium leishanense TaxID=445787 RepID=A0A8C5LKV0_9ANUR
MWSKRNYIALLCIFFSMVNIGTQVYTESLDNSPGTDVCGPPPTLAYGELKDEYLNITFGKEDRAYYKCRQGYARIFEINNFIYCMDTLQWSEPDEFCARGCGPPARELEYAILRTDFLDEPSFHNFTWSNPEVFCTLIPVCKEPPRIQFAELKEEFLFKTTFNVGDKVIYQCRPGYISSFPRKNNFLTCQRNREWNTPDTFCELRKCGYPGDISHGELQYEDFLFGSRVTYICLPGYRMNSKRNSRECLANGQWSNEVPECEAVICTEPVTITNGNYHPLRDEYQYLDSVTYSCSKGLDVIGESSMFCTEHGTWSSDAPECKWVQCGDPYVRNAKKVSGYSNLYSFNFVVTFQCYKGFHMVGSPSIKCNINSLWEPEPPKCVGVCLFEALDLKHVTLDEEFHDQRQVVEDTIVHFHCVEGFEPFPDKGNSVRCVSLYKWSTDKLCTRKSCGNPGSIENGYLERVSNKFLFDSSVIYACDKRYKMVSNATLYCQANGKWDRALPTCEVITCAAPDITDGKYSPEKEVYFSDDLLSFSCNGNLKLVGERYLSCISPGNWNSSIPKCQELCDSPPVIQNAILESIYTPQKYFNVSETVQYECKPGYIPINNTNNKITCSTNLNWSSPETFCQRLSCGDPGEIPYGNMTAKDFLFESKAYYTCVTGYKLTTYFNYRECHENGSWSKFIPECTVQTCPVPAPVCQGSYFPKNRQYNYLDTIKYECHSGLTLFGKSTLTCTEHGKWSSFAPQCKESHCDKIWAVQEEVRKCSSTPDEWIKYLQVEYLYLQIENLKLDIEKKKKERKDNTCELES